MTQTEYAKHRGVSQPRVAQLMPKLREAGAVSKSGKIYSDKADAYLNASLDVRKSRKRAPGCRAPHGKEPCGPEPDDSLASCSDADIDGMTLGEALRIKEVYKAKRERISFEKDSGLLVEVEKVKQAAFDEGRRLRDAILGVPDRISALLAAEGDEFRVNELLTKELKTALREVASNSDA